MDDLLFYHRLQFAFTITFHYLFPQLTMGLALIITLFKGWAVFKKDEHANAVARFLIKIFALNFLMGVVTGIPMEFQFGTNWSRFSARTGGIVGQTLAMEGAFSFVLESSFLALLIYGEKWLKPWVHFACAVLLFIGSWLSGYLVISTNSWMQHPVGHEFLANGKFILKNYRELFFNPWQISAFFHNQMASLVTASFVTAAIGAIHYLSGNRTEKVKLLFKVGIWTGLISSILVAIPTGDRLAKMVEKHQPATFAAMEGLFKTPEKGAEIILIGQPDMDEKKLDNAIAIPNILSFLTYQDPHKPVKGMDQFKQEELPTNIPMLYYAYHLMIGLGTLFIGAMLVSAFLLMRKTIFSASWVLWGIIILSPLTYIANISGWYTAELGRQPWLVYGLMKVSEGSSPLVSEGNALFTLLGFVGLYLFIGLLFCLIMAKLILKDGKKDLGDIKPALY